MSTYSQIRGTKIVTTDNTFNEGQTIDVSNFQIGQLILNEGDKSLNVIQCFLSGNGVWNSQGTLSTARYGLAGAGTNTSTLAFGGQDVRTFIGSQVPVGCTESYNGSTWSAGGAMGTARGCLAGAGASNTAALAFGGSSCNAPQNNIACTESYNGTSWTAGGAMATARRDLAGAGTNTSALAFGGSCCFTPATTVACTESYNGTSWTAGGAMGTARNQLAGAGTNTSALAFGGRFKNNCIVTESYNGSTWSAGGAMATARYALAGDGASNTAALAFGGHIQNAVSFTESYNVGKLYKKIKI